MVASRFIRIVVIGAMLPLAVSAQQSIPDLTTASLEDLFSMEVTSVSRHQEELRKTPAAVYVITQEDIHRSGVTDVAELFRMVPGIQVAQIESSIWAVSARGFNAEYSTKLLIIVDGRTVYDPTFSGVYWRLQNFVLEDIERIEVIRGPGATMWGANAVNGVISITTKRVADTQGGLLVADAGTGRPAEGSFRFGGSLGSKALFRVFSRQTTRSSLTDGSGASGGDSWNMTDGGFRVDWNPSKTDSVTVESSTYRGVIGRNQPKLVSLSPLTYEVGGLSSNTGGHILARWNHSFANSSELTFQTYYDKSHTSGFDHDDIHTFDFDLQYSFKIGSRNDVMLGFGTRHYRDDFHNDLFLSLTPSRESIGITSGFVQDEITLARNQLYLTVGTKAEHSSFSGDNVQPALHLAWLPAARQSVWASVSRSVRTSSRAERGVSANVGSFQAGPLLGLANVYGQEANRSEGLNAYEAGYRYQANSKLWLDVASFFNVYDHLSTTEQGATFFQPEPVPHVVAPVYFGNGMKGKTYGAEVAANYKVTSLLSLKGSYSLLRLALHGYNGTVVSENAEGQSPRHQIYIGSFLSLPRSFQLSGHAYFVGSLPTFPTPAYTRIDLNLGWKALEHVELNLVGQNLLGSHMEFGTQGSPSNVVKRSMYGKATWRF